MNRTELPAAVYAAAGVGELAYQQLRKLPETAARTLRSAGEAADAWRDRVRTRANERDLATRLEQVRESARHGAATLAAQAAVAQEKATISYRSLVARGERVVNERLGATTGHAEPPTKIEVVVGEGHGEPEKPAAAVAAGPASRSHTRTGSGNGAGAGKHTTAKAGAKPAGKRATT